MEFIVALSGFILFVRAVQTLFLLNKTLVWLSTDRNSLKTSTENIKNPPKLYLLIPVLREQKRIISTLEYLVKILSSGGVYIYVITTQREFEKAFDGPSTYTLVTEYITDNSLEGLIEVIDYPNTKGVMADQLNYALEKISDMGSFISVYNADSLPSPLTFREMQFIVNGTSVKVVQQSAVFLKNIDDIDTKNPASKYLLEASAILQTRWTLVHELTRMLYQCYGKSRLLNKFGIVNCVGHGLFIRRDLIGSVGGFPCSTATEDVPLGYYLRSMGEVIYPLKQLELADSPKTILGLWNQKYVWFWGPLMYISYFNQIKRRAKQFAIQNLTVPAIICLQGLLTAFEWAVSGPMVILALVSPLITSNIYLILLSYIGVILYGPVQYLIILIKVPKLFEYAGSTHKQFSLKDTLIIMVAGVPAIIFNSIPPFFTFAAWVKSKLSNTTIYKPKTDD